jgi:cell cycle sensor histidine kinase DivJ
VGGILDGGGKGRGVKPQAPPRPRAFADPAVLWQLGWAVTALASAAIILVAMGNASLLALLALLTIALPGLIGALWRPRGRSKPVYLGIWALAAAMAATLEGGLGGPLAVWCVMPAIVTIVLEAPWICGVGLSVGALLVVTAINALHMAWRLPTHPLAFWLSFVAVLTTAAGAVGGLSVARQRAKLSRREVEVELEGFQALMGDLPELALAMDLSGRAQAVFGRPLPGVDVHTLHEGLLEVVDPADREKVLAAMHEAADHGHATIVFAPAMVGAPRIAGAFQRTASGGLTAILREAPLMPARAAISAAASIPVPVLNSSVDLARRLKEAETERDKAEAERDKAEADATGRARFLANMSHELRTPLNAIMGFSDIMRTKMFGDLQPKYAEYAELIHESGRHLLDLINDVLDMSKIEAHRYELSRETFDVREAVNAALRLVRLQADEAGVKLRGVLPAGPLEIDADRRAIKQIVLNLVSNALKFTPAGGMVTVTVDEAAGALDLVVADTGMGIASEDLERLGRPYEQAANGRAQGTGLGLSLVRAFAELHGGTMNMESRLGEGTAVAVRLPVLVEAMPEPVPTVAPSPVAEPVEPTPLVVLPIHQTGRPQRELPVPKVAPGGAPEP